MSHRDVLSSPWENSLMRILFTVAESQQDLSYLQRKARRVFPVAAENRGDWHGRSYPSMFVDFRSSHATLFRDCTMSVAAAVTFGNDYDTITTSEI